jgi:hypothetical protein
VGDGLGASLVADGTAEFVGAIEGDALEPVQAPSRSVHAARPAKTFEEDTNPPVRNEGYTPQVRPPDLNPLRLDLPPGGSTF